MQMGVFRYSALKVHFDFYKKFCLFTVDVQHIGSNRKYSFQVHCEVSVITVECYTNEDAIQRK